MIILLLLDNKVEFNHRLSHWALTYKARYISGDHFHNFNIENKAHNCDTFKNGLKNGRKLEQKLYKQHLTFFVTVL